MHTMKVEYLWNNILLIWSVVAEVVMQGVLLSKVQLFPLPPQTSTQRKVSIVMETQYLPKNLC